ncbi:hypothetical protein GCM10023219_31730 [Stakelama sediminis]|uniref:Uncharacterized protein n=1 Tax=Stakelama sediminis TaxID=463200 RepID=A0A840Z1P6_9SPHN|nr:hypothetical protein [Stakelama sediminis]MBB5719636.1 hypothetical protein [Stakelama sediminis]
MTKALESFTITPAGEDYLLQIEDEDGETIDLAVSVDQLDLMMEEIERNLDAEDDAEIAIDADDEPEDN